MSHGFGSKYFISNAFLCKWNKHLPFHCESSNESSGQPVIFHCITSRQNDKLFSLCFLPMVGWGGVEWSGVENWLRIPSSNMVTARFGGATFWFVNSYSIGVPSVCMEFDVKHWPPDVLSGY